MAFRADDRVLAEVVELCTAAATEALGAELGFCHGPGFLGSSLKLRCFTWRVSPALSIAGEPPGTGLAPQNQGQVRRSCRLNGRVTLPASHASGPLVRRMIAPCRTPSQLHSP